MCLTCSNIQSHNSVLPIAKGLTGVSFSTGDMFTLWYQCKKVNREEQNYIIRFSVFNYSMC